MAQEVRIKLTRAAALTRGGKPQAKDSEHTVSAKKAQHLLTAGKAILVEKPTGSKATADK